MKRIVVVFKRTMQAILFQSKMNRRMSVPVHRVKNEVFIEVPNDDERESSYFISSAQSTNGFKEVKQS